MKRTILLMFTLFIMFLGMSSVHASVNYEADTQDEIQLLDTSKSAYNKQCKALFGDPKKTGSVAYYLQTALNIMKYIGIVLCIVLTVVDFFKALVGDDKDMTKSLSKKALTRVAYAVVLFFLPTIVKALLTLIDVYGTCGIA